ncbi:MAG: cyclic nucleotide-binding domain-containing protein [Balneolaceae bacterium]
MNTVIEKVMFLQDVELFMNVPTEQLSHLAAIATAAEAQKGATLFEQNDPSDALYIVIDGKVGMFRNDELIYETGPEKTVGALGFFDQKKRIFTARCLDDCKLLTIDASRFYDLLEERLNIARYIMIFFVKQLRLIYDNEEAFTSLKEMEDTD